ncbi:serine/threonine protein kinase [Myxococcus stipitatus DSM 14675]|uniref:Serine/threonine protein kinase n=1 Tax=Myxococcus stipitatus (strain DSM 14675 / JCM 12634 / Mx s8) TaxID=1278073 RepID=L7U809_MYXSD|nr:serine/threonine-protein kinase [Myxococcus stipitatus]AGC44258.1 serine/threonine protein kinase [Myxococcus stipitatus DSM 14675]
MHVGKYQLVRKIASGGMAEVYLAKAAGPMGFEKTLVLKRILPHLAEDPAFVEMFLGEARLAAQLEHPNVVQIFDFGEADGSYFLAMELIDGPTLRRLVKRAVEQALPPVMCAKLVALAAEGLAFAHDFCDPVTGEPLGLIHRDVSPDNILVSRQGAVKVVDFGVAKVAGQGHRTQTGVMKGKVAYMPPEQLRTLPLDRRVDVYALGVVLYELLTGKRPFDATTEASTMQAILFEPFVPVVERRPDVPVALQEILKRALAKERDERYPDCRAFQADLERYLLSAGESVGAYQIAQFVGRLVAEGVGGVVVGSPAHGVMGPRATPRSMVAPAEPKPPVPTPRSMVAQAQNEVKPPVPESLSMEDTLPTTPVPQLARMVLERGAATPGASSGEGAEARERAAKPAGGRKRTASRPALPAHPGVAGEVRGTRDGWSTSGVSATIPLQRNEIEQARERVLRESPESEVADEDHISTGAQTGPLSGRRYSGVLVAVLIAVSIVAVAGLAWFAFRGQGPKPTEPGNPSAISETREEDKPSGEAFVIGGTDGGSRADAGPALGPDAGPALDGGVTSTVAAGPLDAGSEDAAGDAGPLDAGVTGNADGGIRELAGADAGSRLKNKGSIKPKPKAKLEFRVRPYGEVSIGSHSFGVTPIEKDVMWEVGKVMITFTNAELKLTKSKEFVIEAGKTNLIKFNFYED